MNELAIADPNLHVIAETPDEMKSANQALIEWCAQKIKLVKEEHKELQECYEVAKKNRWRWRPLKHHAELAAKRVEYYKKMEAALRAGYYIVPNFPVSIFAIRTNRDTPLRLVTTNNWSSHEQKAQMLPQGEGDYKSSDPHVWSRPIDWDKEKKQYTKTEYWAESFKQIEFPISMMKPRVMEAVTRAMAMKIFDDFGILPGHRKVDPVIVGRIIDPRNPWRDKLVSFIIAWALDTEVL
jgi:hypothetical protein